ncbi:alkyl hydroperoxide reductase subunit F [Gluconacetobacter tumulisoli]|uniref:Thioredoxin reductase n=1 Tax=Gluconacetobacter tumulisoli TaxID=1286189 RepID=A0A7W4K883_9PROT|nr:alkyl hydroperoxide reductase subunit F [Gluconacetobacter tumulisoli]MBB2202113.1 alkyl hydroperoxide reductase subunit F [Gluconacetobacter tumulisoli]
MLDDSIRAQLRTHFSSLSHPVELVPSLGDDAQSAALSELLQDLAGLSDRITVRPGGEDPRRPSFLVRRPGTDIELCFAGVPMGHEFTSLILAVMQVGGHPPKIAPDVVAQIRALDGDYRFETYFSLSCQNCPEVVQVLNAISVINPRIRHVAIDGALFQDEVEQRQILSVPSMFLNGAAFAQGRMDVGEILSRIDKGAAARSAARIAGQDPFDVLVVGGGPAGAAAAVYTARKGVRTGLIAERFGGQVRDTMAIENFISVAETEGPKLAAALEQHVRAYDVEIMTQQRVAHLAPAVPGGLHAVTLESGVTVQAKSVVLAPGARWRQMDVPGEAEYRNKGVAYCPHCDGPLFKGKRVAVVGGGNSGVEAAIDLAGLVTHVTLLEYGEALRADAVLQRKLRSLANVTIITMAQTVAVHGNGRHVTGLTYRDRRDDGTHQIELAGIFVQIGLVPNTEWLDAAVPLTPRGEIETDHRGATPVAGIFAAGDATISPYKQIVIAAGDGAKAALSAFDFLIRLPAGDAETERSAA